MKNTKFAGTDFTYDDLEAARWSDKWVPSIKSRDQETTVLELTPKPGRTSDYSKQSSRSATTASIPFASSTTTGRETSQRSSSAGILKQVQGYWVCHGTTMEDLRNSTRAQMLVSDLKLDSRDRGRQVHRALSEPVGERHEGKSLVALLGLLAWSRAPCWPRSSPARAHLQAFRWGGGLYG